MMPGTRSISLLLRSFTRARGFATAAVLTVALGIGANAVVFALFDRVLFRPLPYHEPDRLVQVHSQPGWGAPSLPLAVTLGLARETGLFSGMGWATGGEPIPLTPIAGENPLLWLTGVTTGSLEVLGVRPAIGPGFPAMRATLQERPVLLTYETWQRQYDGSDHVLSLAWTTREHARGDVHWRVVGVLPQEFLLPSPRLATASYDGIYGVDPEFDRQIATTNWVDVAPFARLAPGVSMAAAQAHIDAFVASRFPPERFFQRARVVRLQSGLSTLARPYVWLAVAGAWAVLGAASLTLAMLLLTWAQSRRQDAGVRLALGASPRRLVASALAVSVVLCAAGAGIGWLAYASIRPLFVSLMPPGLRTFAVETADVRVILATSAIALLCALVAGALPAMRMSRTSPVDVLRPRQDARGVVHRLAGGSLLLSAQAALGVVLLVGALTILPSVLRALLAPPGFDATDLFVVTVATANDATASDVREQMRRGLDTLDVARQLPGVMGTALAKRDPFRLSSMEWEVSRGERPSRSGFAGAIRAVDADFFAILDAALTAGQAFSHVDVDQQALVAVVNEAGARLLWPRLPAASVVGRSVTTEDGLRIIVGVVADFRVEIDAPSAPMLFVPLSANEVYSPAGSAFPTNAYEVMVRMAPGRVPDRTLLSDRLREQPWVNPRVAATPQSIAAELEVAFETPRLLALIFSALAGIALLLTVVAMYGLANFEIRRRREEMTVRLALGATPRALRRRLAIVIVTPVLTGVLAGLPLGWVVARLISSSVAVGSASDPWIYATAAATMLVAALAAAWLPGRHLFTMRATELLRSL